MAIITLIGAGSTVFAKNLIGDILSFPELSNFTIRLHDIDLERLRTSEIVAHRIVESLEVTAQIEATTDRRKALDGADYVFLTIQVAGYRPGTVIDFEIPRKFGLRQTIGDTLGIGGIMRGLRTVPVLLEIARDMEELCPDALLLNYVNPMAINCWALLAATPIRTVGLCHSVQSTAAQLAGDIDVPLEDMEYLAAGINHMAFYLRFERDGEDLYPWLRQVGADGHWPVRGPDGISDRVRYKILHQLGYFVTESSEHFSEYVPWFIKRDRPDLIERFSIPLDEYLHRSEAQIEDWQDLRRRLEADEAPLAVERSHEYGAYILHSIETGTPRTIYGNVMNEGLIDNLPAECCVEVPCQVDADGIQPIPVGSLPLQLAALIQTNINVQGLTVEAALSRSRDSIYHAAMLDPHTAAELDLDQIHQLVDELIEAHGDWLPAYN